MMPDSQIVLETAPGPSVRTDGRRIEASRLWGRHAQARRMSNTEKLGLRGT